jgi:hypothetical protein
MEYRKYDVQAVHQETEKKTQESGLFIGKSSYQVYFIIGIIIWIGKYKTLFMRED